ncbi:MAG TPA: START-like domain-containing protein [Ferruginibacter sp.]|nr:ATPase [Bacteroidota bacterium]MBS1925215.1 ATPase [Bacteroidota bacterium]MCC6692139.1 ATPase [Chitinophagaceae bacterium]HMT97245.1 START-like domain-containing protein [Ferruginibacter sp.]HMU24107.1 START-like domain-containing protein [Ferruginibacter sp.]
MSKKVQYTLEYPVRCSPAILYEFLRSPSGLQEWFADEVNERDGIFTFNWNGTEDKAKLLDQEQDKFVRFQWDHMAKDEFFELSINKSEVTNQTILVIKDFADKKDVKDQSQLWEYQVKDLFHRIGN